MSYDRLGIAQQLQMLIERNPIKRLDAICKQLGIDRHTALRSLREFAGTTFREVQRRALIRKATYHLISSPSLSLKEIASLVGYASEATFSHSIKRALGLSPTEYRHRYQKRVTRET
jgi:methylphosphotriester-DNA--protein-cysteine methyltransferase